MTASTPVVGYPPHRLTTWTEWRNPHDVLFVEWTGACGATGTKTDDSFGQAGKALRRELCRGCFPSGDHGGYFPEPERIGDPA